MRYSEFREYLKGTDFEVNEDSLKIQVNIDDIMYDKISMYVKISKVACGKIILPFSVEEPEEFELIKKSLELAETPLSEREDEKKYYLKHRFINSYLTRRYVNLFKNEGIILSDRHEDRIYKTKFTRKEIEELKEKFDTDLKDFEIVEVED